MSSFNYRAEKSRFDILWDRLAVEYREAGMSPEAIEEMRKFDWDEFKRRRNCCLHETLFSELEPSEESDDSDTTISHARLIKQMVVSDTYADTPKSDQYQWLKDVTSPALLNQLLLLSDSDLALINAYLFEGYSQAEIAKNLGISHQAVAKKLKQLKNFLKNF
jgi:DNA-directed RNA polymerase specialized sigma subunit